MALIVTHPRHKWYGKLVTKEYELTEDYLCVSLHGEKRYLWTGTLRPVSKLAERWR